MTRGDLTRGPMRPLLPAYPDPALLEYAHWQKSNTPTVKWRLWFLLFFFVLFSFPLAADLLLRVSVNDGLNPPKLCLYCQHVSSVTDPLWVVNNKRPSSLMDSDLGTYGARYAGRSNNSFKACLRLTPQTQETIRENEGTVACLVGEAWSNSISMKQHLPGEVYVCICWMDRVLADFRYNRTKFCMFYVFVCSVCELWCGLYPFVYWGKPELFSNPHCTVHDIQKFMYACPTFI